MSDLRANFDRVVIQDASGRRELTVEQFLEIPLSERIRSVISRTATFFDGPREVERMSALDSLRRARMAS
jgi:hypothetical protein